MARFSRKNDIKKGKIFFYCNESDKYMPSNYDYGHPYKIIKVAGNYPNCTIVIARAEMSGDIIGENQYLSFEFFSPNFVILEDEEMFTLQLSLDTEVAGITIDNEPEIFK